MRMRLQVLVPVLCVAAVSAQDRATLRVTVTGAAGRSVFLDQGRAAGLLPGDAVELTPPGTPPYEARVVSVSTNSARAELPPGVVPPPVGTPGTCAIEPARVEVPDARPQRAEEAPEHPPWTNQERGFDPSQPLLAPVRGSRPEERPTDWSGRVYVQLSASRDRGGSRDSDYFFGRLGTRTTATNPFGAGGLLELAFDVDRRGADLVDEHDSTTQGRLERLAYTWGVDADRPLRVQVGRFVSTYLPELGLLDGVEAAVRLGAGWSAGAFAGALPLPLPSFASGEDVGGDVFVEYVSPEPHRLTTTFAYQKTWHEGAPDRDLIVARASMRPAEDLYAWFASKIDVYTSGDTLKGSGAGLSELLASLRYAPVSGVGGSLTYSHFEWPEMNRREYATLPDALIADGVVDRFQLAAWAPVVERVRLRGRFGLWSDQDSDGESWEIGAELDGVVEERTWLAARVFSLGGTYTTGPGFALDLRRDWSELQARLGYEQRDFEQQGLLVGPESFTSRVIRGGVQWLAGRWSIDLTGDWYFGDDEDAFTFGLYGQYTF